MNPIDPRRLAQLRPEKLSDTTIQQQIALIEKTYENVDPDLIAMIFHECDYNFQKTITRIQSEDYQNGGWQMAKSNNKKKHGVHPSAPVETLPNGNHSINPEHSNTSAISSMTTSVTKTTSIDIQPSESSATPVESVHISTSNILLESTPSVTVSVESSNENDINKGSLPSTDSQSLSEQPKSSSLRIETNRKKVPSLSSINSNRSKRRPPSAIPVEPVSIHRAIPRVSQSIHVQFGDIQWIDSRPIVVTGTEPSSSNVYVHDEHDRQTSPTVNRDQSNKDQPDESLAQATERISLASDEASAKLLPSDSSSTTMPNQYPVQQSILHAQSPTVSSAQGSNLVSPTSNGMHTFATNPMQETNTEANTFPLVPSHPTPNYPPHPVEHPQNPMHWNSAQSTYNKQSLKPTMTIPSNYLQQPLYPYMNPQVSQYPISTLQYSNQFYPVFVAGDVPSYHFAQMQQLESYPYGTPNYTPIYPNPQAYQHGMKYSLPHQDQTYQMSFPQVRPIENDVNYGQSVSSGSFQSNKELLANSNLSVTAAPFPHGAANSTTYVNSYQDPRYGPSYAMNNARTNSYPSEQSQRAYSNNPSHSNRHLQQ